MRNLRAAILAILAIVVWALHTPPAHADDKKVPATTIDDLQISPGELKTRLTPLTVGQLESEVIGWYGIVQSAAQKVADAELGAKRSAKKKKEELAAAEKKEDKAAGGGRPDEKEAIDDKHEKVEDEEIKTIAELHTHRTAMVDRFKVALVSFKEKGGDVTEYEAYIAAIAGVNVDTTDVGGTWKTIVAWAKSAEGGRRWLKNLVLFASIVGGFVILALILGFIVGVLTKRLNRWSTLLGAFVVTMTRRLVILAGFLFALSALEVDMGPILAMVGAAGLVIGLALQGTLGNLASGLMILSYRPFDVGDLIETSGVKGTVKSMNLFSTTLLTLDNQLVIVPNNSVWSGVIINVTGSTTRRVDMVFGIAYGDDESRAAELLEKILSDEPLTLDDPAPVVALHELADSSVNFVCRPWVKTDDYWDAYWNITRTVKATFDREGISIPFPQRDVHVIGEGATPLPG